MGLLDDAIREHLELKRRRGADATEISRQESDALGPVRRSPEGVPQTAAGEAPAAAPWAVETTVHVPPAEPPPATGDPSPPVAAEPPPVAAEPPPVAAEPPPVAYEPPPVAPPPVVPPPPAQPEPAFDPQPSHERFPSYARTPEPADEFDDSKPLPEPEPEAEPAGEPSSPSLLSRFKPGGRMRYSRRDPAIPAAPPDPPADPPPAHHEPPPAYARAPYSPPADEPDIVPADEEPEGEDILEETPDFLEETPEHDRLWFEQRPPRDFNFDD